MLKRSRLAEKVKNRGVSKVEKLPKVDERRLENLEVGQWVEGVVCRLVGHGAWVDVGAQTDGFLHVRAMKAEGFVHEPADEVSPGEKLKVCVKFVDVEAKKLGEYWCRTTEEASTKCFLAIILPYSLFLTSHLSIFSLPLSAHQSCFCLLFFFYMRGHAWLNLAGLSKLAVLPPAQRAHGSEPLAIHALDEDAVVWGEVTRITHFGAFVDVGCGQTDAFLHVSDFPGRLVSFFPFKVVSIP